MSRSFRKNPRATDYNKGMKNKANRKVRHIDDIPNGSAYKKLFESWNISDFSFDCSWNYLWENYYKYKDMTKEEAYADWKRRYHSK